MKIISKIFQRLYLFKIFRPCCLPLMLLFALVGHPQSINFTSEDITINENIDGTLLTPSTNDKIPLAIIIPGSGPTDRNGNQNFLKNNSLKKLAESLSNNGIATFRFDKRIVKQIHRGNVDNNIKFEDFVTDVQAIVKFFAKSDSFSQLILIGHSQGSLVAFLADSEDVNAIVSISGAGQSMDKVLLEQITKIAPGLSDEAEETLKILKSGQTTSNYPQPLQSVFNYDLQPFMISWMKYEPKLIISQIERPILIINGTKDLQVSVEEANTLAEAAPNSKLHIIEGMNHIMFTIEGDDLVNSKSYNESSHPINSELIDIIQKFIFSN